MDVKYLYKLYLHLSNYIALSSISGFSRISFEAIKDTSHYPGIGCSIDLSKHPLKAFTAISTAFVNSPGYLSSYVRSIELSMSPVPVKC